jgi:Protein of unknown function (DUF2809)
MHPVRRRPVIQLGFLVMTILLGLGSRRYASALPTIVSTYAGDTLWALALFWFLGLILPRMSTAWVAAMTLGLSVLVELSQLYHAPWIDAVRQTTLGGLILGFGFLWSDLACYAAGVGLGVVLETIGRGIRRD